MVYRIFVEKKPGLDNEARGLKNDVVKFLGIKGLEKIRLLNRYDAENIAEDISIHVEKRRKKMLETKDFVVRSRRI